MTMHDLWTHTLSQSLSRVAPSWCSWARPGAQIAGIHTAVWLLSSRPCAAQSSSEDSRWLWERATQVDHGMAGRSCNARIRSAQAADGEAPALWPTGTATSSLGACPLQQRSVSNAISNKYISTDCGKPATSNLPSIVVTRPACNSFASAELPHVRRYNSQRASPKAGINDDGTSSGWSAREVFTLANNISLARLLSAPVLGWWILQEEWSWCLAGLVGAGLSDWADGYVAKRYGQHSVLGSYLDPLADKAVIGCVVAALGMQGTLSPATVVVLISRDVLLIAGGFYLRASSLGWRVRSTREFFRVVPAPGATAAAVMRPSLLSKANTVLQFALVGSCVSFRLFGWPEAAVTDALVATTLLTTVLSGGQYLYMYRAGTMTGGRRW